MAHGGTYWQKHYFRGRYPDDSPAPEHQSRINLRPFVNAAEASAPRDP